VTSASLSPAELLTTTRAVRKRLDLTRPVPREAVLDCIRLAMQAPTASNAQGWRWLVITDAEKRAAIAEILARMPDEQRRTLAPVLESFAAAGGEVPATDVWALGWTTSA